LPFRRLEQRAHFESGRAGRRSVFKNVPAEPEPTVIPPPKPTSAAPPSPQFQGNRKARRAAEARARKASRRS
jgi:hypothetical protein